jgi:protein-tyrosine phosphatase
MFVEAPDPLLALYRMALDERGVAFVRVFREIAGAAPGAVLFHCTAGKDRTGMIAAFLLRLAGVADDVIVEDYAQTSRYIGAMVEALQREAAEQGRERKTFAPFQRSDPPTMRGFLRALDDEHGGAEAYLERHGLSPAEIAALRGRMRADSPRSRAR